MTTDGQVRCVGQERGEEFGLGHMESKEPMGHLSEGVQQAAGEIGLELRRKEWARNTNYMLGKFIVCY